MSIASKFDLTMANYRGDSTSSRKPGEFVVGDKVSWRSSNTNKSGTVVGVVPAKTNPGTIGFDIKGCGMSRDGVSYIVKGRAKGGKSDTLYWPVVSLLNHASQLTVAEIEWCHANVEAVRALMADKQNELNSPDTE